MLKTVSLIALALFIALGGGAWSVKFALDRSIDIGAIEVGPWVAHPELGTVDADPYMRARYARDGNLALGRAEGIEFRASRDNSGALLTLNCNYEVKGAMPPARFWTIHATDEHQNNLPGIGERQPALSSVSILREAEPNTILVSVGTEPTPGNWLSVSGDGQMQLVLSFYDTPIANRGDVSDNSFPAIRKVACNG